MLFTRPLDEETQERLRENAIEATCISFIETTALPDEEITALLAPISSSRKNVAFTSMNAAEAVGKNARDVHQWNIFALGTATLDVVNKYFDKEQVIATGFNASSLADAIIDKGNIDEIVFFCGDQRREELPRKLRERGIHVNEITVYTTAELNHTVEHWFDAVVFFSPSAVRSFFSVNTLDPTSKIFAIGETTATEAGRLSKNEIITGDNPGKKELVNTIIKYYSQRKNSNEDTTE